MPSDAASASAAAAASDLSANWKSALCVTSLYDSYVQLQQENAALQAQVQELTRHTHELLASKEPRNRSDDHDEDDDNDGASRYAQLRREVRLLRAEKEQLELVLVQQRQHTDAQLRERQAQFAALADKYEQRHALDPNGAKRVALAVKTLQETLEGVVQEKEELARRHETLRQRHLQLQQEQSERLQLLQAQVEALTSKKAARTKRAVGEALQRWYSGQLASAWKRWTATVALQKLCESEQHARDSIRNQIEAKDKLQRSQKASRILAKCIQSSTRRGFLAWRLLVQRRQHARDAVTTFRHRCAQQLASALFGKWKRDAQARGSHRRGLERLERVLSIHCKRSRWRKWTQRVFVQHVVAELHKQVTSLQAQLESTSARLATAENEKVEVVAKYGLEQRALEARVSEKHLMEGALIARIGCFFARQNGRHFLQSTMAAWKAVATTNRVLRRRASRVQEQLSMARARRGVLRWRTATQNRRRYVHIMSHCVARMRQLGVHQCFDAWKVFMDGKRERAATIRRVVLHIAQKHLNACFERWSEFRSRRQEMRARLEAMEATAARIQRSAAFAAWRRQAAASAAAAETKRQRELQQEWQLRFAQAKHDARVLRRCLLHWRRTVQGVMSRKQLAAKVLSRWRNMLLSSVLNDWQHFVGERKRQRELVARWLRRYSTVSLQHAWTQWQKQIMLKAHQEVLARVREEHEAVVTRLQTEILQLHTAHQNLVSAKTESTQTLRTQLERSQREMERETRRQEKLSSALLLLVARKESDRLQRASFRDWRHRVAALRSMREFAMKFTHRVEMRKLATMFDAWWHLLKQRSSLVAAVRLLRSFVDQQCICRCFTAWNESVQRVRSVRHFQSRFQDRSLQWLLRGVLCEWQRESRKSFLVRRTAERIWRHSVHVQMRELFDKWAALSRQQRLAEQKTQRKDLLASIQSRIFSRWTSCSVRLVVVAWRLTVRRIRRSRQAESKLVMLRTMHLLRAGLESLRDNVARKLEQRKRVRRLVEKRVHEDQSQAFALWKAEHMRCQRQVLETLRGAHARLEAELLCNREEAVRAAQDARGVGEELEKTIELAKQHANMVQALSRERILDRHFRAWRSGVRESQHVERLAHRLAIEAFKKRELAIFSCWKATWTNVKLRRITAESRRKQRDQVWQHRLFQAWNQHARHQRKAAIQLAALADQRRTRVLRGVFQGWRSHLDLNRGVRIFMLRVDELARRLRLSDALEAWRRVITATRSAESKERERQRRIVEFIMGRHGWTLDRVFGSWRSVTTEKKNIHSEAHQRFVRKSKRHMTAAFAAWKLAVRQQKHRRRLLVRLSRNLERHFMRTAVSAWHNRVHECKMEVLHFVNTTQARELKDIQQRLESANKQVEEFQYSLLKSGEQVSHLEGLLVRSGSEVTTMRQRHQHKTQQIRVLVRLILQRSVSRTTLVAFARWKTRCEALQSCDRVLQRLEHLLNRKQSTKTFMRWKAKAQRASRLLRVRQRVAILRLRTIFNAWTRHYCVTMRAKMLLLRLCVVMEAQDAQSRLTVRGAFFILRQHCIAAQILSQMMLLQDSAQLDAQATTLHRAKLLLAKWSWRAYFDRVQALHRFFSRCRGESSRQQVLKFHRVVEDLQAAKERLATHELQLAEKQRLAESAMDERSVVSSCLPGLRSLFRHLAQVASTKELFTKISSTFPQMLHGSSGV